MMVSSTNATSPGPLTVFSVECPDLDVFSSFLTHVRNSIWIHLASQQSMCVRLLFYMWHVTRLETKKVSTPFSSFLTQQLNCGS